MYNISFGIGGKQFPVNPKDLIQPYDRNNITTCVSSLGEAPTPLPGESYWMHTSLIHDEWDFCSGTTFNYVLGDPFCMSIDFQLLYRSDSDRLG